ncbi:unnamed protein product, partial [Polarella glacialis]
KTLRHVPWLEIGASLALALLLCPPVCLGVVAYILCSEARRLRDMRELRISQSRTTQSNNSTNHNDNNNNNNNNNNNHNNTTQTRDQGPQLVSSPYSGKAELQPQVTSLVLQLLRLLRICVPTAFSEQGAFLIAALLLSFCYGLLACLVPSLLVRPLWTMVKSGQLASFKGFVVVMLLYNAAIAIVKASANFCAMRAMVSCRAALVRHHHAVYMNRHGRLYYTLGNLDNRVDMPDARITNDSDLLLQFLFEFVLGGVMKPESGMCCQLFFLAASLGVAHFEAEQGAPGWGLRAIGISLSVVLVSLVPTVIVADGLTKAQERVQAAEAGLRSAHAKCRLFAESICFYGGEATEAQRLDRHCAEIYGGF